MNENIKELLYQQHLIKYFSLNLFLKKIYKINLKSRHFKIVDNLNQAKIVHESLNSLLITEKCKLYSFEFIGAFCLDSNIYNLRFAAMSKKIQHNQSKSLWNYTLSPGWKPQEVHILKLALMKFGIGKWKKIVKSKCLAGKSIGQIYMQTQRLLGQQSLGDFMGLHLNLEKVFQDNMKKTGVTRKNNFIINTSNNPTKDQRRRQIQQNRAKYGLSKEEVKAIKLPRWRTEGFLTLEEIQTDKLSTLEKLIHLENLKKQIQMRLNALQEVQQ